MAQDTYKDALDRAWKVDITVAALKRMRTDLNFSLDSIVPTKLPEFEKKDEAKAKEHAKELLGVYQAFLNDDEKFSNVLWSIVRPQAAERGIAQESFDEGLKGTHNIDAQVAFHWSFTNFSTPSRKSFLERVTTLMEAQAKVEALAAERMQRMEAIGKTKMDAKLQSELAQLGDEQLERIVDAALAETSKPPAGS
jgi:hypothetical protein